MEMSRTLGVDSRSMRVLHVYSGNLFGGIETMTGLTGKRT